MLYFRFSITQKNSERNTFHGKKRAFHVDNSGLVILNSIIIYMYKILQGMTEAA